jgi:hypothetical protein
MCFGWQRRRPDIGSIRQHTSEYVSIRQHTSAYVSTHVLICFGWQRRRRDIRGANFEALPAVPHNSVVLQQQRRPGETSPANAKKKNGKEVRKKEKKREPR